MKNNSAEKTPGLASRRLRLLPNIDAVRFPNMLNARRKLVFEAQVRPAESTMQQ